jgi:hypothetical protein
MAEVKKTETKAAPAIAAPAIDNGPNGAAPIPIKSLQFRTPSGATLPGGGNRNNLHSGSDGNLSFDIALLPWLRQYRVIVTSPNKDKARRVWLIHESEATAELAE